ncbi:MAG: hypothetical protein QXH07_01235 [Thermoplasmata archaeon]
MKIKNSIIGIITLMLVAITASADTATLISSQGQINVFNITLNKTSSDIGINTFAIINNNNISIESTSQNCTITNSIYCNVIFIIQQGTWTQINVFDNGNLYESIPLQTPISYTPKTIPQETFIYEKPQNLLYIIVAIVASIFVIGNIAYYIKNRKEI